MEKVLYLECSSGISGDMTVGALLDLGADPSNLREQLRKLPVEGYTLHFGRKVCKGHGLFDFDVFLEQPREHSHDHGHDHARDHIGEHFHSHDHGHEHSHGHDHSHSHRTMKEIRG